MILNREVLIERFKHLEVKTAIEMRDSQIDQIEVDTFQGLYRLMTIDLGQNQIVQIDKNTFSGLTNLREIWLNNNQLKYIHPETFSGLTSLRTIYLHENYFECKKLELTLEESVQYITFKNGWHNDFVFPFLNFILNKTKKESSKDLSSLRDIKPPIVSASVSAATIAADSVSTLDSFSNQTLNKPKLSTFVTKSMSKLKALNELTQSTKSAVPIDSEVIVLKKQSTETNQELTEINRWVKPTDLALSLTTNEKKEEKPTQVKTPVSRFLREKPKLLKTPYSETKSTPSSNRASNSLLEEIITFLTPANFSSQSKRSSLNFISSKDNLSNKLKTSTTQETINNEAAKKTETIPSNSVSNRNSLVIDALISISNSLTSIKMPTSIPIKTDSTILFKQEPIELIAIVAPPSTPTPHTEIQLETPSKLLNVNQQESKTESNFNLNVSGILI